MNPNSNLNAAATLRASRREWLASLAGGCGGLALAMLEDDALAAESTRGMHFPAKVRRVVQLFMNGGVSQMDTFDYKPELSKQHGKKVDFGIQAAVTSVPGNVMQSPFEFRQHGQCGRWVSAVFPHLAQHVDELAFLLGLASKSNVHGPASYLANTGSLLPGFPCFGSWVSYALGNLTDNLPTFVVLPDHRGLPYNNTGNFAAGFLPAAHSGTLVRAHAAEPLTHLKRPAFASEITPAGETEGLALLHQLNAAHAATRRDDSRIEARMDSFELAARMQLAAPEAFDLSRETAVTQAAYGLAAKETEPFGRSCLVARRLLERGVRFVQVWSGMGGPSGNWDNHTDIPKELPFIARSVDQPIAALLTDLKQRGLWDDTLILFNTEFGRMPFTQGATGRDHNGGASLAWMAGGGVQGGVAHGSTDDFSYQAAEHKTTIYDVHATALHLLGIDHTRLTVRRDGIDRRLTDVHGEVIRAILS